MMSKSDKTELPIKKKKDPLLGHPLLRGKQIDAEELMIWIEANKMNHEIGRSISDFTFVDPDDLKEWIKSTAK